MNLFQNYLVEEFAEDYREGHLSRRQALKLIGAVTGSLLTASTFLAGCAPPEAPSTAATTAGATATTAAVAGASDTPSPSAEPGGPPTPTAAPAAETSPAAQRYGTVSPDDPAVTGSDIEFPGEGATLLGYLASPAAGGPNPVVLVCHENRGLTAHIKDVTRRLAKAGYTALAVDLLSRLGGTAALTSDQVPGALGNTPPEQFVQDFLAGWRHLQGLPQADAARLGMIGFCFGGGVTWLMATRMPELLAAVPFYGPHPPVEQVPNIQAAVRAIYAGNDQRINQGIPAIEAAMAEHGKTYEKLVYPNVEHAFHNDTSPRYNAEAARDAWGKTLEWLERYLRAG